MALRLQLGKIVNRHLGATWSAFLRSVMPESVSATPLLTNESSPSSALSTCEFPVTNGKENRPVIDTSSPTKRFHSKSPMKLVEGASEKRQGYIPWEDYFMSLAILASKRSKDPVTQVGCVLVSDDNKVMGTGYNGMPNGCEDDEFPWGKGHPDPLRNKHTYVCHAEMNAIVNSLGAVRGCTLYTVLFPCNECAKLIVQTGIKKVVFMLDRDDWAMEAARIMFSNCGIEFRQFKTQRKSVLIEFDTSCYEGDANFDKDDA